MGERIGILVLMGLWAACGEGLTTEFPDVDAGAGDAEGRTSSNQPVYARVDPPTLGAYGKRCGSFTPEQSALATFSPDGTMVAFSDKPGHVTIQGTAEDLPGYAFDAHTGRVTSMVFSPKDGTLATAGVDGKVKLWREGIQVAESFTGNSPNLHVAWSHSGHYLVATSEGGGLTLYSASSIALSMQTGLTGRAFLGQPWFTPDDRAIVVHSVPDDGPLDGVNHYWYYSGTLVETSMVRQSDTAEPFRAQVVAQSPDSALLVYSPSGPEGPLFVGRLDTNLGVTLTPLWKVGLPARALKVAFTGDSRRLAVWGTGRGGLVPLYNATTGALEETVPWAADSVEEIAFSPDGRHALVVEPTSLGGEVRLVRLEGSFPTVSTDHRWPKLNFNSQVSVSVDGTRMASPMIDQTLPDQVLGVWDLVRRELVAAIAWNLFPIGSPGAPRLSARGDFVYGVQELDMVRPDQPPRYLRVESLVNDRWGCRIEEPDIDTNPTVALSDDGNALAATLWRGTGSPQDPGRGEVGIRVYAMSTCTATLTIPVGQRNLINRLVFSPDATTLVALHCEPPSPDAVATQAPTTGLSVWNVADGRLLWEGSSRTLCATDATFSPDGATLVLVGPGSVKNPTATSVDVYDVATGIFLRSLDDEDVRRAAARFSPDGRFMALQSYGGGITVWRTADWQRFSPFGEMWEFDAVFMPGGQAILQTSTGDMWCPN